MSFNEAKIYSKELVTPLFEAVEAVSLLLCVCPTGVVQPVLEQFLTLLEQEVLPQHCVGLREEA